MKASLPNRFTELREIPVRLQIGRFTGEMLGWWWHEPVWWRNYLHVHSFFEVCYAYQGQAVFHIQRRALQVRQGQVFVARPDEPHEIISSKTDPLGIFYWTYTLVGTERQSDHQDPALDQMLWAFLSAKAWVSDGVPHMGATLQMLTDEIRHRRPGFVPQIRSLAHKLVIDTARAFAPMEPELAGEPRAEVARNDRVVTDVLRYIHDNFDRPIRLRDIAAQVHLSERHLSRLFVKSERLTIREYLTSYRIKAAAQRLLDPGLSITEVARMTGFKDVRYFSTLFRERTGLAPTAYRKRGGTVFLERDEPE